MSEQSGQDIIKQAYQKIIQDDLDQTDLKAQKKAFIEQHFNEPAMPWYGVGTAFAPALCIVFILAFLGYWAFQMQPSKTVPAVSKTIQAQSKPSVPAAENAGVDVRKVTSDVGSVMVYHRESQKVPLTVVWVFTP